MKLRFAAVLLVPCGLAQAEPRLTQSDFGGVGLLQTPTARMAPAGELSVNASRTSPYSRYSLSLQPFDWLEGRYVLPGHSSVPFAEDPALQPIIYDIESIQFPENMPQGIEKARSPNIRTSAAPGSVWIRGLTLRFT